MEKEGGGKARSSFVQFVETHRIEAIEEAEERSSNFN